VAGIRIIVGYYSILVWGTGWDTWIDALFQHIIFKIRLGNAMLRLIPAQVLLLDGWKRRGGSISQPKHLWCCAGKCNM